MTVADQSLALPRWAHVPGTGDGADHAVLDLAKALVPARFDGGVPADHSALVYGLRLNDEGFFWEAHEILEAVWMAAPQGGRDRICLRGCIQVANANLKLTMGRPRAAQRLIAEAVAEFAELARRRPGGGFAAAFPVAAVLGDLEPRASHADARGTIQLGVGGWT